MSESINFAALQEFLDNQRSTEYISVHALEHWNQVEFNGLLLAPHTGADIQYCVDYLKILARPQN